MVQSNSKSENKDNFKYDPKAIQKAVSTSLAGIEGLLTINGNLFSNIANKIVNTTENASGIKVEMDNGQVTISIKIIAEYGVNIVKLYDQIAQRVQGKVKELTGLDAAVVNVAVVDIKTKTQHEKDSASLQDRLTDATHGAKDKISLEKNKIKINEKK